MNAISLILGFLLICAGVSSAVYGVPGEENGNPAFRTGTLIGSVLVALAGLWLLARGMSGGRRVAARRV